MATIKQIKAHIAHGGNRKPKDDCAYCIELKAWKGK